MSIQFTDKQLEVQQKVREFAEREVAPLVEEMDRDQSSSIPLVKKMAAVGFVGGFLPVEDGGRGEDFVSYCIRVQELAKVCPAIACALAIQNSAPIFFLHTENKALKKKYLPLVLSGEKIAAGCLSEPDAGSDLAGLKTTAELDGDYWVINGTKRFISHGDEADILNVVCKTEEGYDVIVVDKDQSPFTVVSVEDKVGLRACRTATLEFNNVRVPKENALSSGGTGLHIGLGSLDKGRVGVAAKTLGLAEAALALAIEHAKTREQFGKPIVKNQGLQWYIAEMAMEIEATRLLVYNAAQLFDEGKLTPDIAAMAKFFGAETAMNTVVKAVQIHGGDGLMKRTKIEKLYRDAKGFSILEGTSEVQKIVIARAAIGR
ncbi:MAG: acyl-CoA dehydrogenase family protein [Coriobacteriia bacterium]|nr:acyl-CoA dehydrogenase family protein [Coriobacteriia bacterium]MCL2749636.1 acyl-CoA dehydrogenase family protein [Coriobacteriia bacterium]